MFAWEGALMGGLRSFLAARLGALVPRATQAFIYGSTARAREGLSSDLDVAVILPPGSKPPVEDSVLALMGEVTDRYGIRLELVIGTGSLESLQRSDRRGYRLWRAIAQEGIPIFERAA
jgi:predicted nucleotidyltransferase